MTVYVDPPQTWNNKFKGWCHMATDGDPAELHELAVKIGLKATWYQADAIIPHYDVSPAKRQKAIEAGAVELSSTKEFIRKCKKSIR